jgi:hypothetical protein
VYISICESFQISGTLPDSKEFLKIMDKGYANGVAHFFRKYKLAGSGH